MDRTGTLPWTELVVYHGSNWWLTMERTGGLPLQNHQKRPFLAQCALLRQKFEPAPRAIFCHQPLRAQKVPMGRLNRRNHSSACSTCSPSANYADIHTTVYERPIAEDAMPPQDISDRRIFFSSTLSHISIKFPPAAHG